jgi:AraC family transcriptional regulator
VKIEFKELTPIRVATLRHIGPYNQIGAKIGELCQWGAIHGANGPGNDVLAIYYDNPQTTPPEQLRSDAALKVDDTVQAEGNVKIATIEGGIYAVGTYIGAYCGIAAAWGEFMAHLGQMGRKSRPAPCFEIYVSDPCCTAEAELVTEFYEPVEAE